MDTGPQYDLDDEFKALARMFQSEYRAKVLNVPFQDYGNRLTDTDAASLLNYYECLNARETLRARYPGYSRKRDADMLRSEHIPFNLLAPLNTDKEAAGMIIQNAWGIDCGEIKLIEIEYAPAPKQRYLNDGTAFDAYILTTLPSGERCGIGVEVKYTEQAYPIRKTEAVNVADHDSAYWKTARASNHFIDPDNAVFATDSMRQIWRNHLLGLSMVLRGELDRFYSVTLYPAGNGHFTQHLPEYIQLLRPEARSQVIGSTFEQFIAEIGGSPQLDDWRTWLEQRYLVKPNPSWRAKP